ncbi:diguanylate cyclase, partial [Pseudomonas sp.]
DRRISPDSGSLFQTFPNASLDTGALTSFTISIGISAFHVELQDATDWLNKADQALYAAKRSGRNQVSQYTLNDMSR